MDEFAKQTASFLIIMLLFRSVLYNSEVTDEHISSM